MSDATKKDGLLSPFFRIFEKRLLTFFKGLLGYNEIGLTHWEVNI